MWLPEAMFVPRSRATVYIGEALWPRSQRRSLACGERISWHFCLGARSASRLRCSARAFPYAILNNAATYPCFGRTCRAHPQGPFGGCNVDKSRNHRRRAPGRRSRRSSHPKTHGRHLSGPRFSESPRKSANASAPTQNPHPQSLSTLRNVAPLAELGLATARGSSLYRLSAKRTGSRNTGRRSRFAHRSYSGRGAVARILASSLLGGPDRRRFGSS